MRVADRLALDGAQPEALRGVVGRLLEPAVVEHQHLGLAVFEEQLAVVGAFEAVGEVLGDARAVEAGAVDQERVGGGSVPPPKKGTAGALRERQWRRLRPNAMVSLPLRKNHLQAREASMRHKFAAAILAVLFTAPLPALTAETGSRQIAGRIELHPIPTLTLSDQQFLTGDSNGKPVTVSGALRLPPGTGRVPVVVLMHGSGGVGPNVDMWAKEFAEFGFASFVLDGFTGRGLVQVSTDQAQLGRLNFILDIYRSLDILAKHPRVDPERDCPDGLFARGTSRALR